jgi:hypothetical protein
MAGSVIDRSDSLLVKKFGLGTPYAPKWCCPSVPDLSVTNAGSDVPTSGA